MKIKNKKTKINRFIDYRKIELEIKKRIQKEKQKEIKQIERKIENFFFDENFILDLNKEEIKNFMKDLENKNINKKDIKKIIENLIKQNYEKIKSILKKYWFYF